jgi:hypothetical protein
VAAHDDPRMAALAATVESLTREIEGLVRAGRLRAVVEQAKGVLIEREGLGVDQAFDRLREISQQQNARLVDVAATIVGVRVPEDTTIDVDDQVLPAQLQPSEATSGQWRAVRDHPRARRGAADVAVAAMAESESDGDRAARLLVDLLAPTGVAAAVLFGVASDASLRVLGQHGYPSDVVSAWRRLPLDLDLPLTRAVNDGIPVFLGSHDDLVDQFPGLAHQRPQHEALAVVPIWDLGARIGSIGLAWAQRQVFTTTERQRVLNVVRRAGTPMVRNLRGEDADLGVMTTVLRLVRDPWMVLLIRSADCGGLVVESVSAEVPDGGRLVGHPLLASFPGLAADVDLCVDLVRLAQDGGYLHAARPDSLSPTTAPWDPGPVTLRATRVGPRLVLSWQTPEDGR